MTRVWALAFYVLLGACAGSQKAEVVQQESGDVLWPPALGQISLARPDAAVAEADFLDIGLAIFDPGIPQDESTHSRLGVFPAIRKAEARYIPSVLATTLQESGAWGAVRVLPEPDESSEVLVTGTIVHSDGLQLVLSITASDASGQHWFERIYHDRANESDYPVKVDQDPYGDLYRKIANDLLQARQSLSDSAARRIRQVALLRYAQSLSPEAFGDYLSLGESGVYQIQRLPAAGDPMTGRVERIRQQQFRFIDTADEQYQSLHAEMAPTYNLWRQYGREQAIYKEDYQRRLATRDRDGRRGTYAAMAQTYNAYKWSKIQDQDLEELALGFNNEVNPTVLEVQGRVFRLNGSLDTQYHDWRRILREIFALETGLPPDTPD